MKKRLAVLVVIILTVAAIGVMSIAPVAAKGTPPDHGTPTQIQPQWLSWDGND